MPGITPGPVMKIAMGFMAAKFLFAANEIGLFEALASGPASLGELATRIAVPSRTTAIVAAAMVSLGLIEQEEGRYRNSAEAAAFLSGGPGFDLRMALRLWNGVNYPMWQRLEEAVRAGHGQPQFGKMDQSQQQMYSAGVEAFTTPVAAALATAYDFSRHRRLLDVGGGTGSFLLALLRHYPQLEGTLFDLPGACAVARRRLAPEPERTRIEIIEGEIFKAPLPQGHDVLLLANVVHHCSEARNLELLGKLRAITQKGARLLLVDFWSDPTHSEPMAAALMSGTFLLVSGEGQTYSEQEADEWLEKAKWRKLECKPLTILTWRRRFRLLGRMCDWPQTGMKPSRVQRLSTHKGKLLAGGLIRAVPLSGRWRPRWQLARARCCSQAAGKVVGTARGDEHGAALARSGQAG